MWTRRASSSCQTATVLPGFKSASVSEPGSDTSELNWLAPLHSACSSALPSSACQQSLEFAPCCSVCVGHGPGWDHVVARSRNLVHTRARLELALCSMVPDPFMAENDVRKVARDIVHRQGIARPGPVRTCPARENPVQKSHIFLLMSRTKPHIRNHAIRDCCTQPFCVLYQYYIDLRTPPRKTLWRGEGKGSGVGGAGALLKQLAHCQSVPQIKPASLHHAPPGSPPPSPPASTSHCPHLVPASGLAGHIVYLGTWGVWSKVGGGHEKERQQEHLARRGGPVGVVNPVTSKHP